MTNRLTLPTPLVSTDWLKEHLGDPDLRVLDATAHLAGPESALSSPARPAGSAPPWFPSSLGAGHEVTGLARSDALAAALTEAGARVGRHLDLPVVSVPASQASEHFGFLAWFLAADNPPSSALTRELLGWQPLHPRLIDDLSEGHCFHTRPAPSAGPEGHRGGTS